MARPDFGPRVEDTIEIDLSLSVDASATFFVFCWVALEIFGKFSIRVCGMGWAPPRDPLRA